MKQNGKRKRSSWSFTRTTATHHAAVFVSLFSRNSLNAHPNLLSSILRHVFQTSSGFAATSAWQKLIKQHLQNMKEKHWFTHIVADHMEQPVPAVSWRSYI
jgi:hypothetical protein